MQKIKLVLLSMVLLTVCSVNAIAQNRTYYFYPSNNVYYDVLGRQYIFNNGGTWTTARTLPSGVVLVKGSPRVTVYHPGKDVWVGNSGHVVKYKNYKGPKAKVSQGNRGKGKKS